METKTTTQILDQLKALHLRMDPESGSTQAEIDNAAALAAHLMWKHNISEETLRAHVKTEKNTIHYVKAEYDLAANSQWRRDLLRAVCDNFFCKYVIHNTGQHNNRGVAIVGPQDNIEVVIYLYEYLQSELTKLADAEFEKAQPKKKGQMTPEKLAKIIAKAGYDIDLSQILVTNKRDAKAMNVYAEKLAHGKSWKNSFYGGAINAINRRLADQRKQDIEETYAALRLQAPEEETEEESRGLIVLKEDQIKRGTEKQFEIYFPKLKNMKRPPSKIIGAGWSAGHTAGEQIPLRQGIKGQKEQALIEAGA